MGCLLLPFKIVLAMLFGSRDADPVPDPPCTCADCQRARAALFVDLGYYPGVPPRRADVTWATDPTVYYER